MVHDKDDGPSLLFAIFAFIFVKFIKKEKFFSIPKENTR